jgi:hypothetical protein
MAVRPGEVVYPSDGGQENPLGSLVPRSNPLTEQAVAAAWGPRVADNRTPWRAEDLSLDASRRALEHLMSGAEGVQPSIARMRANEVPFRKLFE